MLVNSKKLLDNAKKGGYAVPATDVFNLESLKGVLKAAKETNCPLMIAVAEVHTETFSLEESALLVKHFANMMEQDIVLHLDHGYSEDIIKRAIDCGYTSVMFDGSSLPFSENVEITKRIVEYAHKYNVTVEAEIGHVGSGGAGSSEIKGDPTLDTSRLTTAEEAIDFVKATNVDSLAISIGTAHGDYIGKPKLDFERLEEINKSVSVPLVLHGGSGTGYENLSKAVTKGISKVNIFTDLINAAKASYIGDVDSINYYDISTKSQEAICNKLKEYYDVFMTRKCKG